MDSIGLLRTTDGFMIQGWLAHVIDYWSKWVDCKSTVEGRLIGIVAGLFCD